MALPYTDSPLGALLATLGQGIPALGAAHRARAIQDQDLKLRQQEIESRLATDALQRQKTQSDLDYVPVDRARQDLDFAGKIDPLAMITDRNRLKTAGVDLPDNYVPTGIQNHVLQQSFQNDMIRQLLSEMHGDQPTAAPQGAPAPQGGAPPTGGPLNGLNFFDKMRLSGLNNGPRTIAEEAQLEAAKKQAENAVTPPAGPQLEDLVNSTQLIPSLTEVVNEARKFGGDGSFGGQLAAKSKLGVGDMMYKFGILPPDALGGKYHNVAGQFHARAFAPFAKGTRNAKFIEEHYGPHIIEGTDAPELALQKAQDMASLFADQFDAAYRVSGKPAPANPWRQFLQQNFQSNGFAQKPPAAPQGAAPAAQSPAMLKAYADQFFGGDINAARQAATASIANRYGK